MDMSRSGLNFLKIFFLLLFFFLSSFSILYSLKENKEIKLTFFDVGQGDACLVNIKNQKKIIIDGGPDNLILRELGNEINYFNKKINFVVVSHFHHDHIIGLIEIFKRFEVEYLVYGKNIKQIYPSNLLLLEAEKQNTKIIEVDEEIVFSFEDDCYLRIINPITLSSSGLVNDNTSLLSKLDCHGFTFLSAGDNEDEIEEDILGGNLDISAQVFKASHHGSKTSNTRDFLEAIYPDVMVISVGKNNNFKHPSPEVLERAKELEIRLIRTDKLGTIDIFANVK